MVKQWVSGISFLGERIASKLENECVDGDCFMTLTESQWLTKIQLDFTTYYLLDTIFLGWKSTMFDLELPIPTEDSFPVGSFDCAMLLQ